MLTKENSGMVEGNQNDVVKHVVYNRKAILLVFTAVSNYCSSLQQHFLLGNYSFMIKALNPLKNTVTEGYRFVKPVKISMFYDVANLVKANGKHVNNDLTKEDVDPVLYLWDPDNQTW